MIPFGKILKFKSYDTEMLERMKNDFALSVSIPFLQYCANYYKKQANRDPYIEELKMLERLSLSLQNEPQLISIRELYTNDLAVAQTYGDMMQKRRELFGESSMPVTTGELSTLASNYLARAGKKIQDPLHLTAVEDGTRFHMLTSRTITPKNDDVFLLLLPKSEQEEAIADISIFLENKSFSSHIKSIQKIKSGGILLSLLQESTAFKIDLDAVCDDESPLFATRLTEDFIGSYLIRIPCDFREAALAVAEEYGACARIVAHADVGGSMTALHAQQELFSLETAFLKTLFSQRTVIAKLQNEKDGEVMAPSISSPTESCCLVEDFCYSQISCSPKNAFFTNAFYTALLAVIKQCLCGTDYTEQQLFIGLRICDKLDEKAIGSYLSTLIGLYRLQAELGIPSSPLSIASAEEEIALSVFSYGKGFPLPIHRQSDESQVYSLVITPMKDGLPPFDALRKLLKELCRMRREQSLLSASATWKNDILSIVIECKNSIENTHPMEIFLQKEDGI